MTTPTAAAQSKETKQKTALTAAEAAYEAAKADLARREAHIARLNEQAPTMAALIRDLLNPDVQLTGTPADRCINITDRARAILAAIEGES